jgi:hypothetical protein
MRETTSEPRRARSCVSLLLTAAAFVSCARSVHGQCDATALAGTWIGYNATRVVDGNSYIISPASGGSSNMSLTVVVAAGNVSWTLAEGTVAASVLTLTILDTGAVWVGTIQGDCQAIMWETGAAQTTWRAAPTQPLTVRAVQNRQLSCLCVCTRKASHAASSLGDCYLTHSTRTSYSAVGAAGGGAVFRRISSVGMR